MTYEELQDAYPSVNIVEMDLSEVKGLKGLCVDDNIAIRKDIRTQTEKTCVLAEELGHYHTTYGDILDLDNVQNRKQEFRARMWGYDRLIGLKGIIQTYKRGCRNLAEMAEELDVTEEYLLEALKSYRSKFGTRTTADGYVIYFEPTLAVMKLY